MTTIINDIKNNKTKVLFKEVNQMITLDELAYFDKTDLNLICKITDFEVLKKASKDKMISYCKEALKNRHLNNL